MAHLTGTVFVVTDDGQTVRVNEVDSITPIINPATGQPYNRSGNTIDLGLINLRDAAIYGRSRPLIPYVAGRLIKSVSFLPVIGFTGYPDNQNPINFVTPNTADASSGSFHGGFGFATIGSSKITDTLGIITDGGQTDLTGVNSNEKMQISDCGPLIFGYPLASFLQISRWQPNTPYCSNDPVLDNVGHIRSVNVNGVSGLAEPVWVDNDTTNDLPPLTWSDDYILPSFIIHPIVEIIEGVSPMPSFPATLEWVSPPQNVAAGATMPDIVVLIRDQFGQPYTFRNLFTQLAILGTGTLNGTAYVNLDTTSGLVTFTGMSITEPGTGYILRAMLNSMVVADPIFSPPFNVT